MNQLPKMSGYLSKVLKIFAEKIEAQQCPEKFLDKADLIELEYFGLIKSLDKEWKITEMGKYFVLIDAE